MNFKILAIITVFSFSSLAHSGLITYTASDLSSGNPTTVGGTTMTTSTAGGSITFITSGGFQGLWLGNNNSSGNYNLAFSNTITSIEIEFDALSSVGGLPVETITNFATNNGAAGISYTNQVGTTFDGTTITSIVNDGQGIIKYSGGSFNSFSFDHGQGTQSGFVIERLVINTVSVPEPGTLWLLSVAIVGLQLTRGKRNA
jgi:hypothetical protein